MEYANLQTTYLNEALYVVLQLARLKRALRYKTSSGESVYNSNRTSVNCAGCECFYLSGGDGPSFSWEAVNIKQFTRS